MNKMLNGEPLKTKWGNARVHPDEYYTITSKKEGNSGKKLHRLIWEDFYGKKVPTGYVIHHLNGNKLDNRIQNLQCCSNKNHAHLHANNRTEEHKLKIIEKNKGRVPWNKGKKTSEESKQKMSETRINKGLSKGKNNPNYKDYIRIIKSGFQKDKQRYKIVKDSKMIKYSIDKNKLLNWALKEYPLEIIKVCGD